MANYTCVAENLAGKRISDPAQLKVVGKYMYVLNIEIPKQNLVARTLK